MSFMWPKRIIDSFMNMPTRDDPYKLPQTDDITIGCGTDLLGKDLWYIEISPQKPYTVTNVLNQRIQPYTLDFSVRCGAKDFPTDVCVRLCDHCMKRNGLLW